MQIIKNYTYVRTHFAIIYLLNGKNCGEIIVADSDIFRLFTISYCKFPKISGTKF